MSKDIKKSKKGFTIIEVVLVLAIAGLIFLMVFVALPTLQRSQRDTQRRQDMSRLAAALTQWQANHNGSLPAIGKSDDTSSTGGKDAKTLLNDYMKASGQKFNDPSGNEYIIEVSGSATAASSNPRIIIRTGANCGNGESISTENAGSATYAILYKLEGAGTSCTDNQ